MSTSSAREQLITGAMQEIRAIVGATGVTRPALDKIKEILIAITDRKELFSENDFPAPARDEGGRLYLISEDPDQTHALYLVSAIPGTASPPHDHTTWAVIAGLEGEEENTVYKRLDDGSVDGRGEIELDFTAVLGAGDGIAFMPEDVHHIQAVSDVPTRHLHLYGRSFDQQQGRVAFNIERGTTKPIPTGMLPVDESQRIQ